MPNPFVQLNNLYNKLEMLPGDMTQIKHLSSDDKRLLHTIGLTTQQVRRDLLKDVQIHYDRMSLYHQVERALEHPLVGAATELYGNYCTVFSPLHNATAWITSESPTYQRELTKLLDRIGLEEKIFDWAYTTGSYGDLFVKVNGIPGKGVISVSDDEHPLNTSRVDHEGVLVGYYKTPMGQVTSEQALMAPWEYVHFRLLGGKKKRPRFGDPLYSEFRTMHLLTGMDIKQVTTKYGTSLLLNALPSYRRLRLAEDSLLLARLSRGLIRYIWKLKVDSSNMEAVGELVDQYSRVLREARSLDTRADSPNFDSRENPMCLGGDTQVSLMDGTNPTIKEMADNPKEYIGRYVLTVNEKTKYLEPKKIKNIRKTRLNTQLVRVHLSNKVGKCVNATPDHKFMLRNGTYKEAQDLKANEALMPYYSCLNREEIRNRLTVYDPSSSCKVVKVVWLKEKEDTYDIEIDGTPNFPVTAGIFVHNSVIEDIFLPVWGDAGDLSFDKIGGEADIRWIRDIEDLRQQLAAALRTPLPLLGAYLKEATGPLGSQAIEKLDINFARMARKLQRTVRNGIKRICQIHLAYMNMDPDPNLFDVQMPEMSTAEEESLKESLKDGIEVVGSFMDMVDGITEGDDRKLDKIELFHYFNQKFLKLEDLDLKDFIVSADALPECKKRTVRMAHEQRIKSLIEKALAKKGGNDRLYPKPLLTDLDLVSYVPTTTHTSEGVINKRAVSKLLKRPGAWLGYERSRRVWEKKYGNCKIVEGDISTDRDVKVGGQGVLPFKE